MFYYQPLMSAHCDFKDPRVYFYTVPSLCILLSYLSLFQTCQLHHTISLILCLHFHVLVLLLPWWCLDFFRFCSRSFLCSVLFNLLSRFIFWNKILWLQGIVCTPVHCAMVSPPSSSMFKNMVTVLLSE